MPERFDFLIVGAGFAGSVLAERIATQLGKTCLVVDQVVGMALAEFDRLRLN